MSEKSQDDVDIHLAVECVREREGEYVDVCVHVSLSAQAAVKQRASSRLFTTVTRYYNRPQSTNLCVRWSLIFEVLMPWFGLVPKEK